MLGLGAMILEGNNQGLPMSFLQVEFVAQAWFAPITEIAVHEMCARAGMSVRMEGAEQDLTGLGLVDFVVWGIFARSGQNASKIDALTLLFLLVESAVSKMFVRADMSAQMEDVNLVNHATLFLLFPPVEYAVLEIFVRADTSAPMEGVNLVDHAVSGMVECAR